MTDRLKAEAITFICEWKKSGNKPRAAHTIGSFVWPLTVEIDHLSMDNDDRVLNDLGLKLASIAEENGYLSGNKQPSEDVKCTLN